MMSQQPPSRRIWKREDKPPKHAESSIPPSPPVSSGPPSTPSLKAKQRERRERIERIKQEQKEREERILRLKRGVGKFKGTKEEAADADAVEIEPENDGQCEPPPSRTSKPENQRVPAPCLPPVHQSHHFSGEKGGEKGVHHKQDAYSSHGLKKEEGGARYHIVKPGESFESICSKYKVSADALREANSISGSFLLLAQRLTIPPSTESTKKQDDLQQKKKIESKEVIETVDRTSSLFGSKSGHGRYNPDDFMKGNPDDFMKTGKSELELAHSHPERAPTPLIDNFKEGAADAIKVAPAREGQDQAPKKRPSKPETTVDSKEVVETGDPTSSATEKKPPTPIINQRVEGEVHHKVGPGDSPPVWKKDDSVKYMWAKEEVAGAIKEEPTQGGQRQVSKKRPYKPENKRASSSPGEKGAPSSLPTNHQNYPQSGVQNMQKEDDSSSHALHKPSAKGDKKHDDFPQKKLIDSKKSLETVDSTSSKNPLIIRRDEEEVQYYWVEPDPSPRAWKRGYAGNYRWVKEPLDVINEEPAQCEPPSRPSKQENTAAFLLNYQLSGVQDMPIEDAITEGKEHNATSSSSLQDEEDETGADGFLRVWKRDHTGKFKWVKEAVADAAVKDKPALDQSKSEHIEEPSSLRISHQRYQLSGMQDVPKEDSIAKERDQCALPDGDQEEDTVRYHIVKPGESLQFICSKYKVTKDNKQVDLKIETQILEQKQRAVETVEDIPSPTLQPEQSLTVPPSSIKDDKKLLDNMSNKKILDSEVEALFHQIDSSEVLVPVDRFSSSTPKRDEEEVQYHWVDPDDSLRWICLKYKVSANDLRKANNFSGSNLTIAPKRLVIPKSTPTVDASRVRRRPKADCVVSDGPASTGRDDDSIASSSLFSIVNEYGEVSTVDDAPMMTIYCGSDSSDTEEEDQDLAADISSTGGGVRYHDVRPTDTIEYLCMKYRLSAPLLRRANIGLTGRNLQTGPKRLIIPTSRRRPSATPPVNTSYVRKGSWERKGRKDTHDAETVTTLTTYSSYTFDDETNTIALSDCLSDGYSTITDQISSIGGRGFADCMSVGASTLADQIREDTIADHISSLNIQDDEPLYHDVRPNDTLQGVCLLYGISAHELRRANKFRGLNLNQAPERLIIPQNKRNKSKKNFESLAEEEKVQTLLAHLPVSPRTKKPLFSYEEARQYLKTNKWNFELALRNVMVDMEWSTQRK